VSVEALEDRSLGKTQSICPRCKAVLDAELIAREGRVVLSRSCPDHGRFEAVIYGDAERYVEIQRFDKPGEEPLQRQTETLRGCPRDCGICPEHAQHTCIGVIEVDTACNLDCPICFAESGSGPQEHGYSLSLEQVESMLDAFLAAEGEPEAVQLSGGEPSIHPQILAMLAAARKRGIPLVMLNTNGIRLARDPRFAPALAELGVHVYLQFDGFSEETQLAIRGKALTGEKLRALDRCAEAGLGVSLAAAVERGVNELEVGQIVRFGVEHPAVTGVFFQPVTHSGRFRAAADPLDKLTNSDVIEQAPCSCPSGSGARTSCRFPAARRAAVPPPSPSMTVTIWCRCRAWSTSRPTSTRSPTAPCPTPTSARRWRGCGRRRRRAAAPRWRSAWSASPARRRCPRSCARSRLAAS
jgi:uncharacterized radical SAM superfamily Fe-S cluster-containing enzyme